MTKLLAVLGILALFTTAAFATGPAVDPTIPADSTTDVTLAIDGYAFMTFNNSEIHFHATPNAEGYTFSDDETRNLDCDANFAYEVTATLNPPTMVGAGTWALVAGSPTSNTDTSAVFTRGIGSPIHTTLTVEVSGINMTTQYGDYAGTLVLEFVEL